MEGKLEKFSKLIGKIVVSIYDGKILGMINGAFFDKKCEKLEWINFFDDESQEEYFVMTKNIFSMGDAVMLKNADCMHPQDAIFDAGINPINFIIFSVNGKENSKISDVNFDEKFCTINFETSSGISFAPKDFLNIGKNVAILKDNSNTKLSNFKTKVKIQAPKDAQNQKVKIFDEENQAQIAVPKKILMQNYNFLIGRKLEKNIYADNKQLIAKKQSKITPQIIEVASKSGKLKDLTNSSIV